MSRCRLSQEDNHLHAQTNKIDPGPALQWNMLINGVRGELDLSPLKTSVGKK